MSTVHRDLLRTAGAVDLLIAPLGGSAEVVQCTGVIVEGGESIGVVGAEEAL